MNRIPKYRSKYYIPQPNNIKPSKKETTKENLAQKISKKTLKFSANRQFGKDITNNVKSNIHSIYSNHSTKIVNVMEKNSNSNNNNNIYIKKHSSTSQIAQKNPKIKISIGDRKLRENKSGSVINKKSEMLVSEYNFNKNNNNTKKEYPASGSTHGGSRLHSSISFGMNANNIRPATGSNSISVRISNPKNYKVYGNKNNRSINTNNNIIISGNNTNINNNSIISNNTNHTNNTNNTNNINNYNKNELSTAHSNLDLM